MINKPRSDHDQPKWRCRMNSWKSMGSFSAKNSPFRLQFTCVNPRSSILDRPSTNFAGSLDY